MNKEKSVYKCAKCGYLVKDEVYFGFDGKLLCHMCYLDEFENPDNREW